MLPQLIDIILKQHFLESFIFAIFKTQNKSLKSYELFKGGMQRWYNLSAYCYLQNSLKCNVKMACIFHLSLLCISSILILPVKNKEVGACLLNGKNLLNVTKVICRQSLNPKNQMLHKSNSFSYNDSINTNHRQISLTGTDHFITQFFQYFRKSAGEP